MSRKGVTLMCYWNGRMTDGPNGISYEGATPKPIRVSYEIKHNELLDKMYGITGFDKQVFKLKVICRYPACREFIPVPIDDDESVDIIFDVARQPETNCMELYLVKESIHVENNQASITESAQIDNQVNVIAPVSTDDQVNGAVPRYVDNQINVSELAWMDNKLNMTAPISTDDQVNDAVPDHIDNQVNVRELAQIDGQVNVRAPVSTDAQINGAVPLHADNQVNVRGSISTDDQVNSAVPLHVDNQANARAPVSTDDQVNGAVPLHLDNQVNVRAPVSTDDQVNCAVPLRIYNQENGTPAHADNHIPAEAAKCDARTNSFLDPGPVDKSVLVLQDQHRSEAIWAGQDPGVLTCRQSAGTLMREWQLDSRIHRYVIQSGFYGVYRLGFIQLDWPLITALVERWRQETHTFHFPVGESTVTLQDVAVLLGLRVHGHVVTGSSDLQWDDLCEELLGLRPDRSAHHGSTLKLSWLRTHFRQPPLNADEETLQHYARAYILGLMGSVLFADKSGTYVQLIFLPLLRNFDSAGQMSWGSATLAHLYRELCRATKKGASEISGPLVLLQLWAWERLHIGHPERLNAQVQNLAVPDEASGDRAPAVSSAMVDEDQIPADPLGCRWMSPVIRRDNPVRALIFYRDQIDQQTDDQMTWQPYTSKLLAMLPEICVRDQHVWRTVAPLICFDIVEWHRPDRVLRQFGLQQGIPVDCDTEVKLHSIDRRGRHHYNWPHYHGKYIELWAAREASIVEGEPEGCPMHYHDPYMEWYRSITRLLITPLTQRSLKRFQPTSGTAHLLVQSLTTIHNQCTAALGAFSSDSSMLALTDIQNVCIHVLQMIGEARHPVARPTPVPTRTTMATMPRSPSQTSQLNQEQVTPPAASIRGMTRNPPVRGRSRGKGRDRGGAIDQCRTTEPQIIEQRIARQHESNNLDKPSSSVSVEGIAAQPAAQYGSKVAGSPSLNPEEASSVVVVVDLSDSEETEAGMKPLPNANTMELQLPQAESTHVSRPKKKKKKSEHV